MTRRSRRVAYVAKACVSCARSKQRCDGHSPCGRCSLKNLDCVYRHLLQKGQNSTRGASPQSPSASRESYSQNTLPVVQSQTRPLALDSAPSVYSPASEAIGEPPSLSTDVGNNFVEMSMDSGQETFPDGVSVNNLTFKIGESDLQGWASLGVDIPWNSSMHSMLDNPLFELPDPMAFFFQSPSELLGQSDVQAIPCPMDSEPMVHQLECETPTPNFTHSLDISSYQGQSNQTSPETTSHSSVRDDAELESWRAEDYGHVPDINDEAYQVMVFTFEQLNSDNVYCIPFTDKHLPSLQHMQIYMQVYFEEYHPIFPLLHKATFSPNKDDWLLSLAVSSIGCLFSKTLRSKEVFPIMQEFLRRAIRIQTSTPSISVAQASVLNQIGMMYGGDLRFAECAHETMAQLTTQCRKIASSSHNLANSSIAENTVSQGWQAWVRAQLEIRLFYCAWLVDSQQVGFFAFSSTIPIDFLQFPMPINEYVWGMSTAETWQNSLAEDSSSQQLTSLRQVLMGLYRYREVPGQLDAFNSLLLVMGILNDLSGLRHAHLYLEILQRRVETLPPTALTRAVMTNIHMVSLLIYFPTREVIAFGRWRVTEAQHSIVTEKLKRWMSDTRSARAALVHACSIWSQVRLSRTNSHHEPPALLYSAISIWALVEHSEEVVENADELPILRLDSLNQDVKLWAAGNEKKRLYLSGVGLLAHRGALARLISETARLLEQRIAWPQAWRTGPHLKQSYAESRRVQ
ncbi:uncharacterized protein FFB20_02049 [Fusarium fujikuroi]|uniref:Transcription factor FFUJ_09177 n=1 Tax=Gibberella fujikuroi (strain CBS 195.34 / IMI 58289 / NRRL A-6831) TaxID=1279085 RepID=TF177_GIBF5|nr:uncharacterized protein FFUJ_09177 [Fusarium fujikuroi IMI 58289]S0EJF2.1 RecName: Full=Transcription factor FFUJ_09177; AltName: Full=DMATS1 biosynthesis cluster protein FFUJ_09177 [Fusarium fujikuroi IMI 58289]KLO95400.1 uncharacterized protein Y057_12820 [Fusarium fujikuroi]CCT73987.1 uncharacterized protein FFUJ_09177 [Fusarium fujikuroi IMI 58289]SCN66031.1 uncharacterized protein FFB20_02049 [Fusarium fujikuroi]SCO02525.1 uncharacterized protein FFC1_09209 [Fusarium fujikuroi]SCO0918